MELGSKIKEARKAAGLTQKELASKIGKSYSAVQKYEIGVTQPPMDVLQSIAIALKVSVSELVNEKDLFLESLRQGLVSPKEIAEEMNVPLERIWDVLQGKKEIPLEFKKKIERVGSQLARELQNSEYRETQDALEAIYYSLRRLNEAGREEAIKRVGELAEIPKYRNEE